MNLHLCQHYYVDVDTVWPLPVYWFGSSHWLLPFICAATE